MPDGRRSADRGAPPPDERALHEAALQHLARYGVTRVTLRRALDRRVDRWARTSAGTEGAAAAIAAAKQAVRVVVARLVEAGLVNDAAFAEIRARRLARSGQSRRATAAHLAARGIAGDALRAALPDDPEAEFAAAIAFDRRRRIGPFRRAAADPEARRNELGMLARAGFAGDVARRALAVDVNEAEAILARLRQA